ncbi:class I SAM-dependent methyltransferase [Actinokineospora enzanensis]|uniref:class I SAM-dependent methyltransferase n=1 Tax=Actinokineospora enzanensis TaxID=155975 RepID=UPI0003697894|nr:class I SAM-dependent methyltransferase [Actinokineospora enzanensis]
MRDVTPDGSPVEVYAALPALGEPEIIEAVLSGRGDVLDLGCGTGRIADVLARRGHRVVAVDESAAMLERVRVAEVVRARIEELRLERRFDVVVLASHLVNTPSPAARRGLLRTVAHHLRADGHAVIEWHPPAWFDEVRESTSVLGEVGVRLGDLRRSDDLLTATVVYTLGSVAWPQTFTARRLSEAELCTDLSEAGLVFDQWLTPDRTWFSARCDAAA